MAEHSPAGDPGTDLAPALSGDPAAMRRLVTGLLPVIQARVARGLWRAQRRKGSGRNLAQEADDLIQDVFAFLFARDGKALRAWDPARGLSLANYVGLLAEHEVTSFLRTGRRSAWTADRPFEEEPPTLEGTQPSLERLVVSRDLVAILLERLRAELSPRGLHLFQALVVEDRTTESVATELALSADAVYAWRSRLLRRARQILAKIAGTGDEGRERRDGDVARGEKEAGHEG